MSNYCERIVSSGLERLQAGAFGGVFDLPAFGLEFIADGISALEVFGLARGLAVIQESEQFGRRYATRSSLTLEPCGETHGYLHSVATRH